MYAGAPIGYKCLSHNAQSVALFLMNHRANNKHFGGIVGESQRKELSLQSKSD